MHGDFDVHDVDVAVEHHWSAKAPGQTTFNSRHRDLNIRIQFQRFFYLQSKILGFGTSNNLVVKGPSQKKQSLAEHERLSSVPQPLGGNQLRYLRCSTNQEPTKRTYGRVARNVTAAPTKVKESSFFHHSPDNLPRSHTTVLWDDTTLHRPRTQVCGPTPQPDVTATDLISTQPICVSMARL